MIPDGRRAGSLRPMLETLRAPLLLSPIADVLAGASVAMATLVPAGARASRVLFDSPHPALTVIGRPVALAALVGVCLLASGMAQNALVDHDADRARRPDRPLPRGAVSRTSVRAVHLGGAGIALLIATFLSLPFLAVTSGVIVVSALYHVGLKRHRLAGSVALGLARGLDMTLGIMVVDAMTPALTGGALERIGWDGGSWPLFMFPALYALYITGASLHASTDDVERTPLLRSISRFGLLVCGLLLLALAMIALVETEWQFHFGGPYPQTGHLAGAVFIIALLRLVRAAAERPPPAVTGVALSNLFLLQAGIAVHFGLQTVAGVIILLLYGMSRLMLRVFPPS